MKILATTLMILAVGIAAHADQPIDPAQLTKDNLPTDIAAAIRAPDLTTQVMNQLRIGAPVSSEGVTSTSLPTSPGPFVEITQSYIDKILRKSGLRDDKINYFEQQSNDMAARADRAESEVLRMTLNRTIDVVDTIMPVSTRGTDSGRQIFESLYYYSILFARDYAATGERKSLRWKRGDNVQDLMRDVVGYGQYGVKYANLLKDYVSDSRLARGAKSAMLIKALAYLGWDIFDDYHTGTKQSAQEVLLEIEQLQQSDEMKAILLEIGAGVEPSQQQYNDFNADVSDIFREAANVYP